MANVKIATSKGLQLIACRRFSHYVGNVRYWFALHPAPEACAVTVVTHIDSGQRVCKVPTLAIMAALCNEVMAARGELDKISERIGADVFRSKLNAAEKAALLVAA